MQRRQVIAADRWLPDISVSVLRKRKNSAWGFIRVDIKCKPDTLVISSWPKALASQRAIDPINGNLRV
jgi:hypothetical protein